MTHNDLSIVVPVSLMAGKFSNLQHWLTSIPEDLEVFLMHDVKDVETGPELEDIILDLKNSKIQLTQERFGSTGAARNAGLDLVKTSWVGFWDSDDLPQLSEYLDMLEETKNGNFTIGVGSFKTVDDQSLTLLEVSQFRENNGNNLELICKNPGIWRFVFKSSFAKQFKYPALRIGEEQLYLAEMNLNKQKVLYSQKIVYSYFKGSAFHTSKKKKAIEDIIKAANLTWPVAVREATSENSYQMNIFARQIVSAIKNGNLKTKICGVFLLLKCMINSSVKVKIFFLQNLFYVVHN
jgi:glycosyltransferase involved in cell wall biosynthesis